MHILHASNTAYGALNATANRSFSQPTEISTPSSSSDNVTLSPEAMKAFEKLAVYAGPAGDYLPQVQVLNNADSHKIGYAAWETSFKDTHQAELEEYGNRFNAHYEDTKAEFDILTADDHHTKVISAKDFNPEFQQVFEDKLRNDPRMLALMDRLGIDKPA